MADESVVVMKSRPEKAGNSLEGKTEMTRSLVDGGRCEPKAGPSVLPHIPWRSTFLRTQFS
jgi:hypothetical protein